MTKILSAIATGFLFFSIGCNDNAKVATQTEGASAAAAPTEKESQAMKNLDASHVVSKAFETGDPSMIDSVVASDFVDHTAEHGDVGRDSLKSAISSMHKLYSDMKMDIIKEVADDDYVFSLMHFTGTNNGDMGMPKGPYDMKALEVVRFKDGKAVEHWEYMEPREMMKMMGGMEKKKEEKKK